MPLRALCLYRSKFTYSSIFLMNILLKSKRIGGYLDMASWKNLGYLRATDVGGFLGTAGNVIYRFPFLSPPVLLSPIGLEGSVQLSVGFRGYTQSQQLTTS